MANEHDTSDNQGNESSDTGHNCSQCGKQHKTECWPKVGLSMMKQPTFNWDTENKYNELKIFRLEVNNNIMTGITSSLVCSMVACLTSYYGIYLQG